MSLESISSMAIDNPIGASPMPLSLGKEREQWVKRAWDAIDEDKLGELNRMMASIASPTGQEKQLALALVDVMNAAGIGAGAPVSGSCRPTGRANPIRWSRSTTGTLSIVRSRG